MKKVSVIVPIYNGERNLKKTIRSIRNSEYNNIEIVLVDDGSRDSSIEIAQREAKEDDRIRVLQKKNGGVASARNYGVENSTGEFITFVDQDDIVLPSMIPMLVSNQRSTGSEITICSTGRLFGNRNIAKHDSYSDDTLTQEQIMNEIVFPILFRGFKTEYNCSPNHSYCIWGILFLRSFWNEAKLKFRYYIGYEDDLLVKIEALSKAKQVTTIANIGYVWRTNLGSATYSTRYVESIRRKQQACLQDLEKSLSFHNTNETVFRLLRATMNCKNYVEAIENYSSSSKTSIIPLKQFFDECIYDEYYDDAIKVVHLINKSFLELYVLIKLLKKRQLVLCILFCKVFIVIKNIRARSLLFYKIESFLKNKS